MKKIIYITLIVLLSSMNTYAYEVGDTVDSEIASQIKLGKGLTVVDFFASWCVSCEKELPLVNKLSEELDEKNVKFVGIDSDEEIDEGLEFQKKLGLKFFVFNDEKQEIVAKFNPLGMPAIYYIKDKKVVKIIFGAVNHIDEVIKQDIKGL